MRIGDRSLARVVSRCRSGVVVAVGFLACAVLSGSNAANAAVIHFSESFPNAGTNASFSTVDWLAYRTASGTADNANSNMLVSNATGRGAVIGYGAKTGTADVGFAFTQEAGLTPIATTNIESITFYSNNSNTTDAIRIAVRLDNGTPGNATDDTWYATNTGFIRNSGTAGSATNWGTNGELESFTFTGTASAWRDLTFVAGSSLSLATSARLTDLPSGNVNAVGLYMSLASDVNAAIGGVVRFDDFQVNAVPEPGAAAGLLALAGCLIRRSRRPSGDRA